MQKTTLRAGHAAKALALAFLSGTLAATPAVALQDSDPLGQDEGSRWRIFLNGGFTVPVEIDPAPGGPIEFESGYLLGGGLGYHVGDFSDALGMSLELEGFYTEAKTDEDNLAVFGSASSERVSSVAAMVNGVLDWRWSESITATIGVGAGYAVNDFDTLQDLPNRFELDGGQEEAFAAQGKLGLVYDLGGGFAWTLGYRYFRTEDLEATDDDLGQTFDVTNEVHSLELGVRYSL